MNCNMSINLSGDIEITDTYEHWKIIVISNTFYAVFEIHEGEGEGDQFVKNVDSLKEAYNIVNNELT